jgi:hypothetical protein
MMKILVLRSYETVKNGVTVCDCVCVALKQKKKERRETKERCVYEQENRLYD